MYEDITFNGIGDVFHVMPWKQFLDLQGQQPPKSVVRNVILRNIKGSYGGWGNIVANPDDGFSNISMEQVDLKLEKDALLMSPIENLQLKDVTINGKPFSTR